MAPTVTDTSGPIPDSLLAPLTSHLPYSYSVLRRGQFTHFPQGTTEHAHYLFATDPADQDGDNTALPKHFAAAFVDLSQTPSTEMFFYSTLQDAPDPSSLPEAELEHALDLAVAVFRRVRAIAAACPGGAPAGRPVGVMVGCLHEATYRLLVARRGLASSYHNPHDVWLFRVAELPPPAELAAAGLRWGEVRRADVPLIASRTNLPKVADHLMSEPSVGVRDGEDALVAWAFMGCAGTLSTLHVEEPYRRKGVAKALASRVLRENSFGDDGWGSADVHINNVQSQALCKSLGGKRGLRTCWTVINFSSIP